MDKLTRFVYLDVCALSCPFYDQSQMRIRLETDAVQLILSHVHAGNLGLIVSLIHYMEIGAIEDVLEGEHLLSTVQQLRHPMDFDLYRARGRAEQFVQLGLGLADAAHLAFAEQAGADFVTIDDRLLQQCRHAGPSIWHGTPAAFCAKENLR
jgi:predicted nucleic acid-binding protein